MLRRPTRVPRWLTGAALVAFLLFSAHFLYFFVDDEGITFVYARNLLRGDGLVYNHVEPRAEGYSNLLHVILASGILALTAAVGWPLHAAFYVAKALSMACGGLVVWLVAAALSRREDLPKTAAAAALATLVFAGPFALWSATSLEAVPFTAALILFASRIWRLADERDAVALAAGAAVLLWRLDGFVFVAAVLAPVVLLGPRERIAAVITRHVLPLAAVSAAYMAFRWLYFGSLLSEPIATKILYKFQVHGHVVTKEPARGYLLRFLDQYGWAAPIAIVLAALVLSRRDRWTRRVTATMLLMVGYVGFVGDWMYGYRFVVPILPFYALMIGLVVAAIAGRHPGASVAAAAVLTVWAGVSGARFARTYTVEQPFGSWLAHPSADPRRYFWHFWDAYQFLRPIAPPGTVTAYNQAGFIPFMLDAENIDDVGLCSRFVARLPTTDVFFTEAGRYSPLTPAPVLRTAEAYVLYRQPAAVVASAGLLRSANKAIEPQTILGGRYELAFLDRAGSTAVYLPDGPPQSFRERRDFLENVVHVSRLRRLRVNGAPVRTDQYEAAFGFLAGLERWTAVGHVWHAAAQFETADVPIYEVYIGDIRADRTVAATFTLWSEAGGKVWEQRFDVSTDRGQRKHWQLDAPVMGTHLTMVFDAPMAQANVRMEDVRVQGQPPALRAYLDATLAGLRP